MRWSDFIVYSGDPRGVVMNESLEDIKGMVLMLLGHDRWNSGLSDERLAEKIAVILSRRGAERDAEAPRVRA